MYDEKFCCDCPACHVMGDGSRQCRMKAPTANQWQFVDEKDWCLEGRALMQSQKMAKLHEEMVKTDAAGRAFMPGRW